MILLYVIKIQKKNILKLNIQLLIMLYIQTYLRIELQNIEFPISNVACDNDAIILDSVL